VFGLGIWELVLLAILLLVVVGPRELPSLLRTVGRGITKLRRMSWELRAQSGIDEIIHEEGLEDDLEAIRSLRRGNLVDALVKPARPAPGEGAASSDEPDAATLPDASPVSQPRTAEHSRADDGASEEPAESAPPAAAKPERTGPSEDPPP